MKLRRFSESAMRTATALAGGARQKSRQPRLTKSTIKHRTTTAADVAVLCRAVFAPISIRNACELTNGEGSRHGEEESRVGLNTGYKSNIATSAERGMQTCGRTRFHKDRVKLHKATRGATHRLLIPTHGPQGKRLKRADIQTAKTRRSSRVWVKGTATHS
jgi:hypothetical protein